MKISLMKINPAARKSSIPGRLSKSLFLNRLIFCMQVFKRGMGNIKKKLQSPYWQTEVQGKAESLGSAGYINWLFKGILV